MVAMRLSGFVTNMTSILIERAIGWSALASAFGIAAAMTFGVLTLANPVGITLIIGLTVMSAISLMAACLARRDPNQTFSGFDKTHRNSEFSLTYLLSPLQWAFAAHGGVEKFALRNFSDTEKKRHPADDNTHKATKGYPSVKMNKSIKN